MALLGGSSGVGFVSVRVGAQRRRSAVVWWLARLPGKQEIRGSIPGRGAADFVRRFLFVYLISCIVLLWVSGQIARCSALVGLTTSN